jgi:predicted site-specific integrase-resolvase
MFEYLSIGGASLILGVSITTLRRWHYSNKFNPDYITIGGHRRYKRSNIFKFLHPNEKEVPRTSVIYSRVSSHSQKKDLDRQESFLKEHMNNSGIENFISIRDLGSGMNYKKKGLIKLIKMIVESKIDKIYLTHKDRLLRFGADLVILIAKQFGTKVVILKEIEQTFEQKLASDVLEIITVFSARLYGSRSNKKASKSPI